MDKSNVLPEVLSDLKQNLSVLSLALDLLDEKDRLLKEREASSPLIERLLSANRNLQADNNTLKTLNYVNSHCWAGLAKDYDELLYYNPNATLAEFGPYLKKWLNH